MRTQGQEGTQAGTAGITLPTGLKLLGCILGLIVLVALHWKCLSGWSANFRFPKDVHVTFLNGGANVAEGIWLLLPLDVAQRVAGDAVVPVEMGMHQSRFSKGGEITCRWAVPCGYLHKCWHFPPAFCPTKSNSTSTLGQEEINLTYLLWAAPCYPGQKKKKGRKASQDPETPSGHNNYYSYCEDSGTHTPC